MTVLQLSETPPEEACLGLLSSYPLSACPLTQVLGGRSRKSERAGLAPLTGQASPPCLRESHLVISARQEHPAAHCSGWAGKWGHSIRH